MAEKRRRFGTVYRNHRDTWTAEYRVNGKRHREHFPTPEAAAAHLAEVEQRIADGQDIGGARQSVAAWLADWLELRRRSGKLAARTLDGYRRTIEGSILPNFDPLRLGEVRASHLQSLLYAIEDDVQARSHGRYSGARTVQLAATVLDQAFEVALHRGMVTRNPMRGVEVPDSERAPIEPATDAQVAAVLLGAATAPHPALWHLYALLGVRRGEPLGMRWADVDLSRGTVRITQQGQAVGGAVLLVPPKGGRGSASERLLPLVGDLPALFAQQRAAVLARRLKAGSAWEDHDLVFPGERGRPLWPTTIDHWWRELRASAGLPDTFRLHHLRHTVATLLDEAQVTEAIKAGILGHGPKNVTQRYTHARIEAMRRALEQVAERIRVAA